MKKLAALLLACGLSFSAGWLVAAEIGDFDPAAANNTARFFEGMAPSDLNDQMREVEAILSRHHIDSGGRVDSTGTDPHFVVAASQTISAYYDGLEIAFTAHTTNADGPATLNVDSVNAATIKKTTSEGLIDLVTGDIPLGAVVTVVYDDLNSQWVVTSGSGGGDLLAANNLSDVDDAGTARANLSAAASVVTTRGEVIVGASGGTATTLAVAASSTLLTSDGTDVAWADMGANQAAMEASASSTVFVTPAVVHHHALVAKGWVKFDVAAVISAQANVESVADNAAGDWTINWDTDFSSSDYVVVCSVLGAGGRAVVTAAQTAGGTQVQSFDTSSGGVDEGSVTGVQCVAYGDQ